MIPFSIRRHLRSAVCACLCAAAAGTLFSSPALRAAGDLRAPPRYRLAPGQELQYHGQSEFKYGKEDSGGALGSTLDWQAWVIRANGDGGWHLVIRSTTKSWSSYGKDAKRSDQPARSEMAYCDLTPDGRVSPNDSLNSQLQPETLFPRLPADATAMANGWDGDRDDGFVHLEFKADPKSSSEKAWLFDETSRSPFDKIYLSSEHSKVTFNTQLGLVERADSENTQGYGFDGKGTGTTELVAIKDHDEAWTKRFADEADRYFKAQRAYQDLLTAANHDAKNADEVFAKAESVLKDARAELKQDIFSEQLDRQLSEHKNQVRWITDEAKEFAERKGKLAAEWKLDDLEGKSHALADYRGKVVVLDFWYRGCGWCIRAMPQVQQLADDFKDSPVAVLGLNKDREEKDARFVVEAMQLRYPILKATGVPEKYGVHGFPTLIVIDQQGTVRDIHVGYSKTLRADVSKIIKDLLAGALPSSPVPNREAKAPASETGDASKPKTERAAQMKLPVGSNHVRFFPAEHRNETSTKGTMKIHVVDADGQPVAAAKIHESVWTKDKDFKHNRDYTSDAKGWVDVELPKTLTILRLWSRKDGYVPLFAHWEDRMPAEQRVIPDEFTFSMEKGMVIGGIVKDEDGKPVSGARVEVMYARDFREELKRVSDDIWLSEGDDAATTNAEGHWSLNNVPPGDETRIRVKLSHPDYVSDFDWGEPVRATTTHFAMVRGTRVTGTITDPDGKPVSGALAIWGEDPYLQNRPQQEVHSDEKGVYRFPPLPDGRMTVTVVAEGWMPQLRDVEIAPKMTPVDFQLKPGKMLRIKFVDQSGNPVPGVGVGIASWRGEKSLYNHKHPNVVDSRIPRQADAGGIYEWTWAPDDPVTYSFGKENIGSVSGISLTADGDEHVQTLPVPVGSDLILGDRLRRRGDDAVRAGQASGAPAKLAPRQRADTPTGRLLNKLEEQNAGPERFKDSWLRTLKETVDLGSAAVPELAEELDATDNGMMMRCLGFSLRAIGDKRAVPALIRAIPKTLIPPGSDMGLRAEDAELAKFAQQHELNEKHESKDYDFGRPVREIFGALQRLTGQHMDEEELYHAFLDGTTAQKRMKRDLFNRTAKKWADWWERNASDFVKDSAYTRVNLTKMPVDAVEPARAETHYKTVGGGSNWVLESVFDPKPHLSFYDLDTGRAAELPEKWRDPKTVQSHLDEILAWAANEGFDLMGVEYVAPDGERTYALRAIGLRAWELGRDRWKMDSEDIMLETLQKEGTPVEGLLLHRDIDTKAIDPKAIATFFYITREGTPGLLFVGIEVKDDSLKAGGFSRGDNELDPIAFQKGRRFGYREFEEVR